MTSEVLRHRSLAVAVWRALAGAAALLEVSVGAHAAPLPLPQPSAAFATLGRASYSISGTRGVIEQIDDRVVLNWRSFDVAPGHEVAFRQPAATSIALNRIHESARPSEILGSITANGQVYLFNPNGFLFGDGARVNVNSLIATSLDIGDDVLANGLTKPVTANRPALSGDGVPFVRDADGNLVPDAAGQPQRVAIRIAPDAKLATRDANGRILIFAPSIRNEGRIEAADGQVLLAAATDKVYLQEADEATGVRGLIVEVATGGDVRNLGEILSARGNVTLAGFAVNQAGRVSATTSVNLNGSVILKAAEGATVVPTATGVDLKSASTARATPGADGLGVHASVTLGPQSVTSVDLDADAVSTAVDEQLPAHSRIDILGRRVRLAGGAQVRAPSGTVTLTATAVPLNPAAEAGTSAGTELTLDAGSVVDVSGARVQVPVTRHAVEVQLFSNELRDAPVQKRGILFGRKVTVDARRGTPLADISGAVARLGRNVAERNTAGGTIEIRAGGKVTLAPGATLNVAGGGVEYLPGYIKTTQLIAADGRVYDIADADPRLRYVATLDDVTQVYAQWGQARRWAIPGPLARGVYDPGYLEGAAGGTLSLRAPQVDLRGTLAAQTLDGLYQREPSRRAAGSHFVLDQSPFADAGQNLRFAAADAAALVASVEDTLVLADDALRRSGFRAATLKTNREVSVARGARVDLGVGGSMEIAAKSVSIEGAIDAAGGDVTIETLLGDLRVGAGATIDVSGTWVSDAFAPGAAAFALDGGDVTLHAVGDLLLAPGSRIDVDGGAWLSSQGELTAGHGGSIDLRAVRDRGAAVFSNAALFSGHGLARGGSLMLEAPRIEIAGVPAADSRPGVLALTPGFFGGGFVDYTLTANRDGLRVAAGTVLAPQAENLVLQPGFERVASARHLADVARPELLPELQRTPVSLALRATRTAPGAQVASAVAVEADSRIVLEPGASFSAVSDGDVLFDGSLAAPAGQVTLRTTAAPVEDLIGNTVPDAGYRATQGVWLGPRAHVSATGLVRYRPDPAGRKVGDLLAGGQVTLRADRGLVALAPGSRVDVSGARGIFAVATPRAEGIGTRDVETLQGSAGGTLTLAAAEGLLLGGEIAGHAGADSGAVGGTLQIALTTANRNVDPFVLATFPATPRRLQLDGQDLAPEPVESTQFALPAARNGLGRLAIARLASSGFAALDLHADDAILLNGNVDLELARRLTLDAPALDAGAAPGASRLAAPYVALGAELRRAVTRTPVTGSATLRVQSELLDLIGGTSLSGLSQVHLLARGDLRVRGVSLGTSTLKGEFVTAGDLTLTARQVYPTTFSDFAIAIRGNPAGTLRIEGSGAGRPVLSAGGALTLQAPRVVQAGTVKAPGGRLVLDGAEALSLASGSVTSVSLENLRVPFGRTLGGLEWIYPLAANRPLQPAPPEKRIELRGAAVDLAPEARVDLSGGGDLQAFEFVPGPGGSRDVLERAEQGETPSYAVLPDLADLFAPFDDSEFRASGLAIGDSVTVEAGAGLAAGTYALLPAHYALLPGAFLVTPVAADTPAVPGTTSTDLLGQTLVPGRRVIAGTAFASPTWESFAVAPGTVARERAEYTLTTASAFYPAKAAADERVVPALPDDAGTLVVDARTRLSLAGRVDAAAGGSGRRGVLDITGTALAIVPTRGTLGAGDPRIELVARELSGLGAASIFVGGTRTRQADGSTRLDITARELAILPGAQVSGDELLLGATEALRVEAQTVLAATGTADIARYTLPAEAAFLHLSSAPLASTVFRGDGAGTARLDIAAGAQLVSSGSATLLSSGDTSLAGTLSAPRGIELGASRISLGDAPALTSGIVLSSTRLDALATSELVLRSRSTIDLYGELDLTFEQLTLDAGGLVGVGAGHRRLAAQTLTLTNRAGVTFPAAPTTPGSSLAIAAASIGLGSGEFGLRGFGASTLAATLGTHVEGDGALEASAALTLLTPRLDARAGTDYRIAARDDTGGHALEFLSIGAPTTVDEYAFGARLSLQGASVLLDTAFVLPSGRLHVTAAGGDVELGASARLDLAGRRVVFADTGVSTPGGRVTLRADAGDLEIADGAVIDVSAASGARAGALDLAAPFGSLSLGGAWHAHATRTQEGGRLMIDVGTVPAIDALVARAAAGGFDAAFALRARNGALTLDAATHLRAHDIRLSADRGTLTVHGRLDADGSDGGRISLASAGDLTLADGAQLLARGSAVNGAGGTVTLDSVGGNGSPGGAVQLADGARIDVRGGAVQAIREVSPAGTLSYRTPSDTVTDDGQTFAAGDVQVRARRTGNGLAATFDASIAGARTVVAEAVRVYDFNGPTTLDAPLLATLRNDTSSFMDGVAATPPGRVLLPGLELRTDGALTLATTWNFADWRFGGVPGVVTLRSAADLQLNASITDGFRAQTVTVPDGTLLPNGNPRTFTRTLANALQSDDSWQYRLVAGADIGSADVLATRTGDLGDVALASGAVVRTGTGDIDIAAAGALRLADDLAAIYTAGRRLPLSNTLDSSNPYGTLGRLLTQFYAEYPIGGGDIRIVAGGDVQGATESTSNVIVGAQTLAVTTHQQITDWWHRTSNSAGAGFTAWGIALDLPTQATQAVDGTLLRNVLNARSGFRQNVGALGGGDVTVQAGGDIRDLSVMLPTTGKPVGQRAAPLSTPSFTTRDIEIAGGGDLVLDAGGNLRGGIAMVGAGSARFTAGGDITGGSRYASGPIVALGEGTLAFQAGRNLTLGAVIDPGMLAQAVQPLGTVSAFFQTYAAESGVSLLALGGDLQLQNDVSRVAQNAVRYTVNAGNGAVDETVYVQDTEFLTLMPGSLEAAALGGDLTINRSFTLSPAPQGTLELLARGEIASGTSGDPVTVNLSDADPARLPDPRAPVATFTASDRALLSLFDVSGAGLNHAGIPVHTGDTRPARLITLEGDIRARDRLRLGLAKSAVISAGRDFANVDLDLQNLAATDVTVVEAGRDIRYRTEFDPLTGELLPQQNEILVGGPGRFDFVAGRDLDLGASNGIASVGNTRNPALSGAGADLGLYAGFAAAPAFDAFAATYLFPDPAAMKRLRDVLAAANGARPASDADARARFEALAPRQRRPLLLDLFFDELRASGNAAARNGDYRRGLAAVAKLFPATPTDAGDIRLFFSRAQTLAGGDIALLAPGGLVNAGLATSVLGAKDAKDLGIVAQRAGAVNVFADGDLQVNASRVFALGGDDITVWSTNGDIDAGRGAKAALSVPPPTVSFDAAGNLRVEFPPAVSGSGIRTASPRPGIEAGDVFLFAVNGIVDAGEAGIGGNNIVIAANAVVGASNIDVGGTAVGVPAVSNVSISAGLTGASNVAASAAQVAEATSGTGAAARENSFTPEPPPALITAEVIGFGDYSVPEIRAGAHQAGTPR